jgi:hypothetical protein
MNRYATVVAYNCTSQVLDRLEVTIRLADELADWLELREQPEGIEASRLAYDLRRMHERFRALRRMLKEAPIAEEGEW